MNPRISELDQLNPLRGLALKYQRKTGLLPLNLSHWDPSKLYRDFILQRLVLLPHGDPISSLYPYYLPARETLLCRLGFNPDETRCLVTPSGTISMLAAVRWLKALGIKRVVVICPTYFPVFYLCDMMGLQHTMLYLQRVRQTFQLSLEKSKINPRTTAIWVTNPVFSTGVYFTENDLIVLTSLLAAGITMVVDECLAVPGHELGRKLPSNGRFLGIYTPHKSILVNAVKFSAITFPAEYEDFFDQWADVLFGGLAASVITGINHYYSDNFTTVLADVLGWLSATDREVRLLETNFSELEFDHAALGHFITCYFPRRPAELADDLEYMWGLMEHAGAYFVPGTRNHFAPEWGLCFRINLALQSSQFMAALHRTLAFLEHN